MFCKKENLKHSWPFLFFGLIGFGIVVAFAILIVILFTRFKHQEFKLIPVQANLQEKQIQLTNNYQTEISNLVNSLKENNDLNDIYKKTEDVLMTVRVPKEMRDAHLQALLEVEKMKEGGVGVEETRKRVLDVIDALVKK